MLAPTAKPLTLGVLGCANIARGYIRDLRGHPHVHVVAVASRSEANAAAFAAANGVDQHFGSYEAMLADPSIQAIYIPLPNSLHCEWAIKAAHAGKHVLCEKPLALDGDEARRMFDAARANQVVLLEAYPYWFQPQTGALVNVLASGAIGEIRSVQASFGFTVPNPMANIRMMPTLGGGALLDAGSYTMSLIRLVMGCAPERVWAHSSWSEGGAKQGEASGVDMSTMATLLFPGGRRAQMSCAMDGGVHRGATIVGSAGVIETEYLNHCTQEAAGNALGFLPSRMRIRRGLAHGAPYEDIPSATGSGFAFAAEAFAKLVRTRDFAAAERAAQASIDIATSLAAIARAARTGQWVSLA